MVTAFSAEEQLGTIKKTLSRGVSAVLARCEENGGISETRQSCPIDTTLMLGSVL